MLDNMRISDLYSRDYKKCQQLMVTIWPEPGLSTSPAVKSGSKFKKSRHIVVWIRFQG